MKLRPPSLSLSLSGMSYMLVGPCVCGVHSVLLEGSFAYPDPLRFARAALEHKVTLFKTGSGRG